MFPPFVDVVEVWSLRAWRGTTRNKRSQELHCEIRADVSTGTLVEAVDVRLKVPDPEAGPALHVDLPQSAGRDQAFDRPDRHAEPLGGFPFRHQQPLRHGG